MTNDTLPRGIRNNNPGNIRYHIGTNWQGLAEKQTDKEFCQFASPQWGIRAIARTMFTYRDKYGLNSIKGIINRYAPPVENNTDGYIKRVCRILGVKPDEKLELTNEVLTQLIKAIIAVENNKNGVDYFDYYSDILIVRAINKARG